ncbi:hypothetical protein GCM10007916_34540 [Psychromonas marina]|uniref:histidine kinase n=1 Tax=Psychromonas marina TaxID=88364 RepID=A0ABQ6E5A5_9GAMM|nr:hypothetical protein GCM10007916_34540 [Psychromonas marina]
MDLLNKDIANLSSIETNLSVGNRVMTNLLIVDKLRLNILMQQNSHDNLGLLKKAEVNGERVIELSNSLVAKHQELTKNIALQSFTSNFNDMNDALNDVSSFDASDIEEWSAWVIEDIVFELFNSLEKLNVYTSIDDVNQKMNVINQLRWIMYYALQENWLIDVMLEKQSFELLEELRTISVKEEIFIGRFLSLNANKEQVDLLLNTFQKEGFQKSLLYKENAIARNFAFFAQIDKSDIESVLNARLALMMEMSQSIISTTIEEIKVSSEHVTQRIYLLMTLIVLVILFIIFLSFNLIQRIFSYLKSTLIQLETIESNNDYTILISEAGNDEFSHFSSKLNKLIAERKINVDKMIQSKEEAERANKAKSYFLANMSHEIRTPLNGILGMYQILEATELSHSQKNHLETINQSSKTLLMLINDILDISKIESGKLTISTTNTNFREALYETISMVSSKAVEKKLKLSLDVDANLPEELMLDEHRLRQIMMNILSNALKFTMQGFVKVIVSGVQNEQRCILSIQVKDTGIGIAESSQETIFQPFVQEDGSITREFGGTGLGLAISSQLVNLMGGSIRCDSVKGQGSTFSFDLDIPLMTQPQGIQPTLSEAAPTQVKQQVIIIDALGHKATLLNRELTYLGVDVLQTVVSVEAIPEKLNPSTILLYCQSEASSTQSELKILLSDFTVNPIVLAQETDDDGFDFRDQIDGQLMIPLLGKRCLKILNQAVENKIKTSISHDSASIIKTTKNLPVLLVEDNLVNQKVASFFLKSFGYDFEIAENGLEAVNAIKRGGIFSTVLMDCMMPIMDGFTATKEIRLYEEQQGLNKVPIIALTASIFDEDIKQCYIAGMDDYLAKPIDKALFQDKMNTYTNKDNIAH